LSHIGNPNYLVRIAFMLYGMLCGSGSQEKKISRGDRLLFAVVSCCSYKLLVCYRVLSIDTFLGKVSTNYKLCQWQWEAQNWNRK